METMPTKKQPGAKLVSKPAKTEEDLAYEEYLRQLELALENH
jgi:hypothetical protein